MNPYNAPPAATSASSTSPSVGPAPVSTSDVASSTVPPPSGDSRLPPIGTGGGIKSSFGLTEKDGREPARPGEHASQLTPAYTIAEPTSGSPVEPHTHTLSGAHHHHHHRHHHHHTQPAAPASRRAPFTGLYRPASWLTSEGDKDNTLPSISRDVDRSREQDKESKPSIETSPTARTSLPSMSPYPRPGVPTSPTAPRTTPSSVTSNPARSPELPSAMRPNIPLPGISSLGARALPSPFERDRSQSISNDQSAQSKHQRALSSSSSRGDVLPSVGPPSPVKPSSSQGPSSASHNLFGGPPPLNQSRERPPDPSRSPVQSPRTATAAPAPTSASSHPGPAYTSYSSYAPPYLGYPMSGPPAGFGGYPWGDRDRDRQKARERERERERELERDRAREREKDKIEFQRQEEKRAKQQAEANASSAANRSYADPYRPGYGRMTHPPSSTQSRIEVLNVPSTEHSGPTSAYPGDSLIQQVAPSREPRPYTYTAKTDPAPAPLPTKDRDYQYMPRDKRPRMDAAVEDARRGNANKAKRRKEEDRVRSPPAAHHGHAPVRDFSALTSEIRVWPEVQSSQVEAWLKSEPDQSRVVARELYAGSDWTLAKSGTTTRENEGGVVIVRINGAFLGSNWILRGETGWDQASPYPVKGTEAEIARGLYRRQIWGTDVYTDDSDLGLVLIHAGWVRWPSQRAGRYGTPTHNDDNVVQVTVRIVPRLIRYTATERNFVQTRGWGNGHDGASIVVEGVQRESVSRLLALEKVLHTHLQISSQAIKKRANRKTQLAELARERAVVFDQCSALTDDLRILNGADRPVIFAGRTPALKYDPSTLISIFQCVSKEDWANVIEEGEDGSGIPYPQPFNLLTNNLELVSAADRYLFYNTAVEDGPLRLDLKHFGRGDEKSTDAILASDIKPSQVHFAPDGVAIQLDGEKGLFCKVDGIRWQAASAA